jgi:hypothetical protein
MRPNQTAPGQFEIRHELEATFAQPQLYSSVELGRGSIRISGYRDWAVLAMPWIDVVLQIALNCVERIVHLPIALATANELIPAVMVGRVVAQREPRQPRTAPDELRAQDCRGSAHSVWFARVSPGVIAVELTAVS